MSLNGEPPGRAADILRLFDAAPIAMCHLEGRDLVLDAVNPAGRDVLGLRRTAIGSSAREALAASVGTAGRQAVLAVQDDGLERRFLHVPEGATPDDQPLSRAYDVAVVADREPGGHVRGVFLFGRPMRLMGGFALEGPSPGEPATVQPLATEHEAMLSLLRTSSGPLSTPVAAYASMAAHVVLPAARPGIGADWFEWHVTPAGDLAIAVGDLGTRGVDTSPAILRLRAVALDRMDVGDGPQETIDALDREARRRDGVPGSSAAVALYRPGSGELEVVSRGYPPFLLLSPGGGVRRVGALGSTPLGLDGPATAAGVAVEHDEVLLACSDSVVSRAAQPVEQSLSRLGESIARWAGPPTAGRPAVARPALEELANQVHRLRPCGPATGALVLAARLLRRPPPSLEERLALDEDSPATLRPRLRAWLTEVGAPEDQVFGVTRAVDEVVATLVDTQTTGHQLSADSLHLRARVDGAGLFTMTLAATASPSDGFTESGDIDEVDEVAAASVAAERAERALRDVRALLLLLRLVDQVHVSSVAGSTVVVLRAALAQPVCLETPDTGASPTEEAMSLSLVTADGERALIVAGPVTGSVEDLRHAIVSMRRDKPLRVDLTGVTDAGSGMVALLYGLDRQGDISLIAAPGSAADTALVLAGIR